MYMRRDNAELFGDRSTNRIECIIEFGGKGWSGFCAEIGSESQRNLMRSQGREVDVISIRNGAASPMIAARHAELSTVTAGQHAQAVTALHCSCENLFRTVRTRLG